MPLQTPRLDLRRLTMDDLDGFHTVWGDPEVIFWGASPDVEASGRTLARLLSREIPGVPESGWFAALLRETGTFLGDVVLEPASWDPDIAEIGWHMARDQQGRGYATEAARALLDHARAHATPTVWAKILPDNEPSRAVARRIGMRQVGSIVHADLDHDLWAIDLA